jgi:hypothetical protein
MRNPRLSRDKGWLTTTAVPLLVVLHSVDYCLPECLKNSPVQDAPRGKIADNPSGVGCRLSSR